MVFLATSNPNHPSYAGLKLVPIQKISQSQKSSQPIRRLRMQMLKNNVYVATRYGYIKTHVGNLAFQVLASFKPPNI